MKNQSIKDFLPPIIFLIITIFTYGLLLPKLGFYGDDWSYIYYHQIMGFDGPGLFAAYDRPFSAPFYNGVIALLGTNPLPYHFFLLILRFLSALLLWQLLRKLWPQKERPAFWISMIFLVYPGFSQQPISVEYILHFTGLDFYLLSMLMMVKSIRLTKWRWIMTLCAVLFSLNIFAIEYFVGLEILRPVFLWIIIGEQGSFRKRVTKTARNWLPYLLVLGGFLVWRVFFFQFPTYTPGLLSEFKQNPSSAIVHLMKRIVLDFKTVFYDAWRQTITYPIRLPNKIRYILAVCLSFTSLLFFNWKVKDTGKETEKAKGTTKEWAIQPIALGLLALLAAGGPFWITGISIEMGFPWDRPTLPFMLGVSLVMVGLVDLLIRQDYRHVIFAIVICLSVGFHVSNAEYYQREWENMKDFYWQLTWRIPGLQDGTILASDEIPLYRVADSAMTAPLNWIYAPDLKTSKLRYKIFDLNVRMGTEYTGIPAIQEGLPIVHDYRSTQFNSTTSSILVFHYTEGSCLRILSPDDEQLPFLPAKVNLLLPLSKLDLILTENDITLSSPAFFNPEEEHGWCYYFQQADLARQQEDWERVAEIGNEAFNLGFEPTHLSELLPFIEGYAHIKDFEKTQQLAMEVQKEENLIPALCRTWKNIYEEIGSEGIGRIEEIFNQYDCY